MKRRKEKPIKIGTSCREILQRNKLILAAFCLPVILMLLAFLVMGIYPAGENQIQGICFNKEEGKRVSNIDCRR